MIKFLSFLAVTAILSFTPQTGQDKEYKAQLTVNEWQVLIANQDDVPKSQRDRIISKIVTQLQQQISADTLKKK